MPITLELKAKIEKARAAQLERYAAAEKEYNTPVGRLITRLTNDTAAMSEMFSSGFVTFIWAI
jgi:ABC-type multidrug transport system fused ATPase/permease subunit